MTAEEARKATKGLNTKLSSYIAETDNAILECAHRGFRRYEVESYDRSFAKDIVSHYRSNGFDVEHIVSPFAKVTISW